MMKSLVMISEKQNLAKHYLHLPYIIFIIHSISLAMEEWRYAKFLKSLFPVEYIIWRFMPY